MTVVQVQVAVGTEADADRIARQLVDSRLAACAQRAGPITSTYRWQGEVEQATEWLVLVKTTADRLDAVVAAIVEEHPYDVPEVVATAVVGGHGPYLRWIEASVQP